MKESRLLIDTVPYDAMMNMAIDESLMLHQKAGIFPLTVRFYWWNADAITIGYFQKDACISRLAPYTKRGIPVVKRPTGGGVVFHGEDLTFSLTTDLNREIIPRTVMESYRVINLAICKGLQRSGIEAVLAGGDTPSGIRRRAAKMEQRVCFEQAETYDIMLNGQKIVGGAQRRCTNTLLHQGSIYLSIERDELIRSLVRSFEEELAVKLKPAAIDESEQDTARLLYHEKYVATEAGTATEYFPDSRALRYS